MLKLIKDPFYNSMDTREKLSKFILSTDRYSFGPQCQKFEKDFANWHQRAHAIMVNSGSSANLALIQALLNIGRLHKGDPVGFSAVTWSTNVMPLIELGLKPIPIDVELDTLNVSPRQLTKVLERYQLKAVFLTNLLGLSDNISQIKAICDQHDILLLEDNCESLGSTHQDILLGNFSLASTASFYIAHHLSTIEGGAILTDDQELAQELAIVRAHGWDRNLDRDSQISLQASHQINSEFYSRYTFYDLGYNLRPTEINGYLGNIQLPYLDKIIQKRQHNFNSIKDIYQHKDLHEISDRFMDTHSSFAIPVLCKSKKHLEKLIQKCQDHIEIRPIVGGLMIRQPFFKKHVPNHWICPNAEFIHHHGFYMANHPDLSLDDLEIIRSTILA